MPEIADFEAFVCKHGKLGGWHPDDHAEFLRLLKRPMEEEEYLVTQALSSRLFHLHLADIQEHRR